MGRPPAVAGDALRGIHVLIVDDNADARDLFRRILEYAGALVAVTDSAAAALHYTERLLPDVVVCDIVMPGHDGYWLLERLQTAGASAGANVSAVPSSPSPRLPTSTRARRRWSGGSAPTCRGRSIPLNCAAA